MNIYYNENLNEIQIDVGSRIISVDVSAIDSNDILYATQSQAVRAILKTVIEKEAN